MWQWLLQYLYIDRALEGFAISQSISNLPIDPIYACVKTLELRLGPSFIVLADLSCLIPHFYFSSSSSVFDQGAYPALLSPMKPMEGRPLICVWEILIIVYCVGSQEFWVMAITLLVEVNIWNMCSICTNIELCWDYYFREIINILFWGAYLLYWVEGKVRISFQILDRAWNKGGERL